MPKSLFIFVPIYKDLECFLRLKQEIDDVLDGHESTKSLNINYVLIDDTAGTDDELNAASFGNSDSCLPIFAHFFPPICFIDELFFFSIY